MEVFVGKGVTEMFDGLHAYGVGIFLANLIGTSVELSDEGLGYRLRCKEDVRSHSLAGLLKDVLALPTVHDIDTVGKTQAATSVPKANLDGLLATLFTTRGVRVVS